MSNSNGKPGGTYRTTYLIAQARYILGTAKSDPAMVREVGARVLGDFESDLQALEGQLAGWHQTRQQGKAQTMEEERAARAAMRWISSFRGFYGAALARGEPLPKLPAGPPRTSRNSTQIAIEVGNLLKSGREYAGPLAEGGCTPAFLARGEQVMSRLLDADEKQEVIRTSVRADERRKLLTLKHRVYADMKRVIAVGRSLYADEPAKAQVYRLRILKRGTGQAEPRAPSPPASENVA